MATVVPNKYPTLADVAAAADPSGRAGEIVEALSVTNQMLEDMPFYECNDGTKHKTTVRSGLPTATWRKLNWGVQPSKSSRKTITDSCGMLEAFSEIDKKLVDLNGKKESWRASEEAAFLEAMGQESARALIYGDSSVDPEKIMGFAPRFNTTKTTGKGSAECAVNVIDAGGTGEELTSIWLVGWGPRTVHGIYPQGSKDGIQEQDYGDEPAYDEEGGQYRVMKTHYEWDLGLTVRDWRYVVRICNLDVKKLKARPGDADLHLEDLLVDALERIPNAESVRMAFYCNRRVRTALRKQIRYADNVHLNMAEVGGKKVVAFDDIPVRIVDALACNESQVK